MTGEKRQYDKGTAKRLFILAILCLAFILVFFVGIRSSLNALTEGPIVAIPQNSQAMLREGSHAITTFLSSHAVNDKYDDADGIFLGIRTLLYQLLHSPRTRLRDPVPIIVLVTRDVRESKRQRLTEDGATVVEVETIPDDRWGDTATKLRIFDPTVVPYEKVLFLDAGTVLIRSIDDIFEDPGAVPTSINRDSIKSPFEEAIIPRSFLLAASPMTNRVPGAADLLDASPSFGSGVFLYAPSVEALRFYISLLDHSGLYDTGSTGHDLLNYAHRLDGPMPWGRLQGSWYISRPEERDMKGKAPLLQAKLWEQDKKSSHGSRAIYSFAQERRWEMEGFWIGKEDALLAGDLLS